MNEIYNKMKYFEDTEQIPAEIYYHYTSLEAFFKIVSSKSFRLASMKSTNDKTELYYKPESFLSDLSKVCSTNEDDRIFELLNDSINQRKNDFFKACNEKSSLYALCMSEKKDNLTHWDRYAVGCKGICIGFNVSSLRVHMQRMAISAFGLGLYDVGKVIYIPEHNEQFIRKAIIGYVNMFTEIYNGVELHEIIHKNGLFCAATVCRHLMRYMKNSSFVDENEIRLYHDSTSIRDISRLIDSISLDIDSKLYDNLKKNYKEFIKQLDLREGFCITDKGIRAYRVLSLKDVWGSGTIPEVVLGPLCVQNKSELHRFLKANGLEGTKVSASKVPIR